MNSFRDTYTVLLKTLFYNSVRWFNKGTTHYSQNKSINFNFQHNNAIQDKMTAWPGLNEFY